MTAMLLAGFCLGIATLWTFLELLALAMRMEEAPKRHLFSELKEGMDELVTTRRYRDAPARTLSRELNEQDGIDYKFLGMGDREDVR